MVIVMEQYVLIGKIVGTHGIKGEIRIISDNEIKQQVFVPNFKIYIGTEKKEMIICSYRHHKIYDMVCLKGLNNINDVLDYKGKLVYVKREDLEIKDYLFTDLINLEIIDEKQKSLGQVKDIIKNKNNILLEIEGQKHFYIPNQPEFIKKVDLENKKIYVSNVGGLMI